jgi:uncharacterized membrane protein
MMEHEFLFSTNFWIIIFAAIVTYLTRIGGHIILSRFDTIHPRVEAGLNAVPIAVITAIVIPSLVTGGWAETITLLIAGLASLRFSLLQVFFIGWVSIVFLRALGL